MPSSVLPPGAPWPPAPAPGLSRRDFLVAGAAALAVGAAPRRGAATAREIADRIRDQIGVPWRDAAGDGFTAGSPDTAVTGIAVAAMPTLDVLRRAAAAGHNLIVTHERLFYGPVGSPPAPASDPVHAARRALVEERRLVVFRVAEHWNARVPNENARALAAALGWEGRGRGDARVYDVAPTTVGAVVALARTRLGASGGLRLVGSARTPVRRVLVSPGTTELRDTVRRLPGADLLLAGEPREWEAVEYVLDTASAGRPTAMISLGRVVSEEPGLRACATWLRPIVPEVLVRHFPTADPYWTPTP